MPGARARAGCVPGRTGLLEGGAAPWDIVKWWQKRCMVVLVYVVEFVQDGTIAWNWLVSANGGAAHGRDYSEVGALEGLVARYTPYPACAHRGPVYRFTEG